MDKPQNKFFLFKECLPMKMKTKNKEAAGSVQNHFSVGNCQTKISFIFQGIFGIFCSISQFLYI
jgi:hypothetical protein